MSIGGRLVCLFAGLFIFCNLSSAPCDPGVEQILRRPFRPQPAPLSPPQPASEDHIGGSTFDGRTVVMQLPEDQQLRNKVGIPEGMFGRRSGLCVFTSIDIAARWQGVWELTGFRDFMTVYPGAGWPAKVDEFLPKMVAAAGGKIEDVPYLQVTSFNEKLLDLAIKTGRMPAITYGYSPRYGEPISHMVNIIHLDDKWCVFLDNNFPGVGKYEWVPRVEAIRRIKLRMLDDFGNYDDRGGWFVVLLAPAPPPSLKD